MSVLPTFYAELTTKVQRNGSSRIESIVTAWALNQASLDLAEATDLADTFLAAIDDNMSDEFNFAGSTVRVTDGSDPEIIWNIAQTGTGVDTYTDLAPPNVAVLVRKVTALGGRANQGRMYIPWVDESEIDGAGYLSGTEVTQYQTIMDQVLTDVTALTTVDAMAILHSNHNMPTAKVTAASATIDAEKEYFRPSDVGRFIEPGLFPNGTSIASITPSGDGATADDVADFSGNGIVIANPTAPAEVTALVVQPQVATQRRRLRG